jgi:FkbM family methyltransferase
MTAGRKTLAIVSLSAETGARRHPRSGAFDAVHHFSFPPDPADGLIARLAAVDAATAAGAEWLALLEPGDVLSEDALELAAPALALYDAIFGAARVEGSNDSVAPLSRLAIDAPERLPHVLLNWWMPQSHLVRTEIARTTLERVAACGAPNWRIDYLFDIWANARCLKSAQALLVVEREPAPLTAEDREDVLRRLTETPVFLPVIHGDAVYHLPYTGRNAGIEREQSRGLFFEAMELEQLRRAVGPGARIVDIGANTGNHTIYFAGPMRAATVVPFEPLPGAAAALRAGVERNGMTNVDLSHLGVGVGDSPGRARLVHSIRGGFGATSLAPDPSGEIIVAPLDSVLSGHVDFLKIDVEGMEMNVLAGAEGLIRRSRPLIFIEIANRNTVAFTAWLDAAGYAVVRIFTDKGHANYLIAPEAAT